MVYTAWLHLQRTARRRLNTEIIKLFLWFYIRISMLFQFYLCSCVRGGVAQCVLLHDELVACSGFCCRRIVFFALCAFLGLDSS